MNDLNGLDWSSKSSSTQRPSNYSAFSTLKPTPPGSGRASPLPPSSSPQPPSKASIQGNDSFSNLVSFSSNSATKNLSLQEQQKRLADLKLQQSGTARTTLNQYSAVDDSVWNNLGSGRSTPAPPANGSANPPAAKHKDEDEDDMFAVFNAPPVASASKSSNPTQPSSTSLDEDDDPFGLSDFQAKTNQLKADKSPVQPQKQMSMDDDEDVLGLLGRPVSEFPPPRIESPDAEPTNLHPQDRAVAELVDMGFPIEKARRALESTESGMDVQAAVGILLNQAHSEAQANSKGTRPSRSEMDSQPTRSRPTQDEQIMPPRREKAVTPSNDPAQIASDLSATFMKTAGSLWKQGQKRFQQAVQEYNSDSDSSQPKWMREASPAARPSSRPQRREEGFADGPGQRQASARQKQDDPVTDEALMLEAQRPEKPARPSQKPQSRQETMFDSSRDASRDHSPAMPSRLRDSTSPQPPQSQAARRRPQQIPTSREALSRQAAEDQAAQAYVSSARRRKPAAAPAAEVELLESSSTSPVAVQTAKPTSLPQTKAPPRPVKSTPVQVRPPAPTRNIPSISAISLKASHVDREAGNNHFKRGDYSSAHQSYSKSLSYLPASHPITVILLTNRALTAIKIGEPKVAVTDSDAAIALIGPAKGESETVDLTNGEAPKPMRDYYGKALMRKAEALEHMEKWADAAIVWREAVESGHGGATAIQARQRAENAAKPKPVVAIGKAAPAKPAGKSAAAMRAGAAAEKAAINKLRAQNAAAEKLDDERFQLSDAVDAKVTAWRGGKQDNLRALLGSLEMVLWPEAGWKKISMADLVLPNKVKIQYMKGIAKVHPDKIPTTATTEQRMIAGAVFSTLNEAWDKFKRDNNL